MISDEELYRQYISGDETGLDELMKKYGDPLTLYINGYLHDVHEAEDLMIEAFSYLFTKKPRIRDGGFKAYLYKTARHMALRHKSRQRLFFNLDDLTEEPDGQILVEEVVQTKERDQILHFCMDELNPDAGCRGHGKKRKADHQYGVPGKRAFARIIGTGGNYKC